MDTLHGNCSALFEEEHIVKVNVDAIHEFAKTLSSPFEAEIRHTLPFKFENNEQEINFIALVNLLSFGSGYDKLLAAQGRDNAQSVVLFGVISLFLSGQKLDTGTLLNMHSSDVVQMLNINTHVETASELKPVTILKPTVLRDFVERVTGVMTETGRILQSRGLTSFAAFVLDITKPSKVNKCTASKLLEALTYVFPAFEDTDVYGGKSLPFSSKAQHFVHDLYMRFSESDPERFDFEDTGQLSISSDMFLVSVLRKLQIVTISDLDVAKAIDDTTEPHVLDPLLRAAAVKAARDFCVIMNSEYGWSINARDVDYELRRIAALPEFQDVHVIRRTNTSLY